MSFLDTLIGRETEDPERNIDSPNSTRAIKDQDSVIELPQELPRLPMLEGIRLRSDNRKEEEDWTDSIEEFIWNKRKEAKELSEMHENSATNLRRKKYYFIIPPIVINAAMTFVTPLIEDQNSAKIVSSFFFMLATILGSVNGVLDFGRKQEEHNAHGARYKDIISMIDMQMSRNKKFRMEADVFMTDVRLRMSHLDEIAPDPAGNWTACCCSKSNVDEDYRNFKKKDRELIVR